MTQAFRLRRPDLVVDDPFQRLLQFFGADPSSISDRSYDAYVANGSSPQDRIVEADVVAINTSMSARSPHEDWQPLIMRGQLPELVAVDPTWDLFITPEGTWSDQAVPDKLAALFGAVIGKGIGISRATKVLYIKRPLLIPICDSYVLRLMGIPGEDAASGVALIQHLRSLRGDLLCSLVDLQQRLRDYGHARTLVRIVDALIWSSHPDTWLARRAADRSDTAAVGPNS